MLADLAFLCFSLSFIFLYLSLHISFKYNKGNKRKRVVDRNIKFVLMVI